MATVAREFERPNARGRVPSMGSTATSISGAEPFPTFSPLYNIGALSFSPSPMMMIPFISTVWSTIRMALTAAPSAASLSPRPIKRPAASAAASVTRASSRARFRVGSLLPLPTCSIKSPWLFTCLQNKKLDDEIAQRRTPNPRVDPVKKSAVPRKDIARVFESTLAFEHAFPEITQRGERADHQTQKGPLQRGYQTSQRLRAERRKGIRKKRSNCHRGKQPGKISLPAFLGAETRRHLVFSVDRADRIRACIPCPDNGKNDHQPPAPLRQLP